MATARAVVRSGLGGLALGGMLYLAGDTASDLIVYSKLQSQAMLLVAADADIPQIVGYPYTAGAWYDATLAFSHRDKVAHCTFQLRGTKGVTDVAVKAGRQPGYKSNVLYNILGPGMWQLLSCQVMVPSEGGLVQPRSLLPEHRQEEQQGQAGHAAAAAAAAAGCQPCQVQQQQQQQQQKGGQQMSGSWWRRLWWQKQSAQQQPSAQES